MSKPLSPTGGPHLSGPSSSSLPPHCSLSPLPRELLLHRLLSPLSSSSSPPPSLEVLRHLFLPHFFLLLPAGGGGAQQQERERGPAAVLYLGAERTHGEVRRTASGGRRAADVERRTDGEVQRANGERRAENRAACRRGFAPNARPR